ncbi:MAG: ABC transporter substrate-binding protein [Burkholderiales bacterium]
MRRLISRLIATTLAAAVAIPLTVSAQGKPPTKVRYAEVVRSILYAPKYIAITKGYFKEVGLEVSMFTAQGGDKAMAALLSNAADIALIGPETAIYVMNSESPMKVRMFSGLTATDGFMLVSRQKIDKFDWKMLKGKEILGFRPGSTPLLFLESAMKQHGLDPQKDAKLSNNVAIPARVGSWLAGQNQFAIFLEPEASQIEMDGKGFAVASIGQTVGFADYTAFMATDKYIKENPEVVQAWTNAIFKAQRWVDQAPTAELVKALAEFFPGVNAQTLGAAAERYRKLKIWKSSPMIDPKAIDKFQDILVQGNVLDRGKRVKFDDLVLTNFAKNAK